MRSHDLIAIVGAGIGGLTLALALEARQVPYRIYERSARLHATGSGLGLWRKALGDLAGLGLSAALEKQVVEYDAMELQDTRGRVLVRYEPVPGERVGASMHRGDLHSVLVSALPPERMSLQMKATGYRVHPDRVVLHLDGKESVEAEIVVAADGLHSTIRQQLHIAGDCLRYSGYTAWRGIVTGTLAGTPMPVEMWGEGERFGLFQVAQGRLAWWATANRPEGLNGGPPSFTGWAPHVRDLIESTAPEDIIRTDVYDRRPLKRWVFHDRVVLLGDAAHPTTPNLGRGACMAIEDAINLARHVSSRTGRVGLRRYELEGLRQANRVVRMSKLVGYVAQLQNPMLCQVRNMLLRRFPRALSTALLSSLVD